MAKQTEPMTLQTSGSGHVTNDHDVIRKWAEERGGKPATVEGTERGDDDVGLIRLEFPDAPGANDNKLAEITWDEWFAKFDEGGLALLYQEHTADGQRSNFNKLIKEETAATMTAEPVQKAAKKSTTKKAPAGKTSVAKSTAKKSAARKVPATRKAAANKSTAKKATVTKKAPAAKKAASKKAVSKKPVAKKPVAKTAVKKSSKKVPAARGYRGR